MKLELEAILEVVRTSKIYEVVGGELDIEKKKKIENGCCCTDSSLYNRHVAV